MRSIWLIANQRKLDNDIDNDWKLNCKHGHQHHNAPQHHDAPPHPDFQEDADSGEDDREDHSNDDDDQRCRLPGHKSDSCCKRDNHWWCITRFHLGQLSRIGIWSAGCHSLSSLSYA